jgi:hypothetical protein
MQSVAILNFYFKLDRQSKSRPPGLSQNNRLLYVAKTTPVQRFSHSNKHWYFIFSLRCHAICYRFFQTNML